MELKELLNLISGGESLHIEFKQKFSDFEKIAKEFIAFANTKGGKVIFGIRDNGRICGVHSEKEIEELTKKTVNEYIEPPIVYSIDYCEYEESEIVIVDIPESKSKPHRIQDYRNELIINQAQVYIRVNDKSVPASKEMIRILRARTEEKPLYKYQVGKDETRVFEYLENKETVNVKELSDFANISKRRASRTLVKMVRAGLLIIHTKDNGEEFFTYSGEI